MLFGVKIVPFLRLIGLALIVPIFFAVDIAIVRDISTTRINTIPIIFVGISLAVKTIKRITAHLNSPIKGNIQSTP